MTYYDYIAIAALVLTILINSLSVYLQKTKNVYAVFGPRALMVHSIVISLFWGLFIFTEFLLTKSTWKLNETYIVPGLLVMIVAFGVFVAAIKQVGFTGLNNANFFGYPLRELKGIYGVVSDPIYISYVLWFIGLGLVTSLKGFFVVAIVAAIGLLCIESRIEKVSP